MHEKTLNRKPVGSWNIIEVKHLLKRSFTLLPDDTFTVLCGLSFCLASDNIDLPIPPLYSIEPIINYEEFFCDPTFNDLKIEIGDKTFYACKLLLAQQSSVFKTMFRSEFRESHENSIRIEEIDASVFEQVLKSIYSGRLPDMELSVAMEMMFVIDRYDFCILRVGSTS